MAMGVVAQTIHVIFPCAEPEYSLLSKRVMTVGAHMRRGAKTVFSYICRFFALQAALLHKTSPGLSVALVGSWV
jgi:hypothetical protein